MTGYPPDPSPAPDTGEWMTVIVRDNAAETRLWNSGRWAASAPTAIIRTVVISAFCPQCGRRRGTPHGFNFYVDGEWHHVHRWDNPCGHIDMYDDVITEADRLHGSRATHAD